MKRILFLTGLLLNTLLVSAAQIAIVKVQDISIQAGETQNVEVQLSTTNVTLIALQCDFILPEGLNIVCDDNGQPIFSLTERTSGFIVKGSKPDEMNANHYRMGMISTADPIADTDDPIITFQVTASESLVGEYYIEVCDIVATKTDYTDLTFIEQRDGRVRASMYSLLDALGLPDGSICMITDELTVAAQIGNHVYATEKSSNSWIRLDLPNETTAQKGSMVMTPIGNIANHLTAPSLNVTTYDIDEANIEDIEIQKIDLAHHFDIPQLSEIVEFSGYYYDQQLRGFRSTGHKGQSLSLDNSYFGETNLVDGQECKVVVGIEAKEPWTVESDNIRKKARSSYDYDFQNLNGKIIDVVPGDIATNINDILSTSTTSNQRYNLLGQPVNNNYRGIVIENGKKIVVK